MAEQPTLEEGQQREANRKTLEQAHRELVEASAALSVALNGLPRLTRNVQSAQAKLERLLGIPPSEGTRLATVRIEWEDPEGGASDGSADE